MGTVIVSWLPESSIQKMDPSYRPGDLAAAAGADAGVYEVIRIGNNGLLLLRGVE